MSKFTTSELIFAFSALGKQLMDPNEELSNLAFTEHTYNAWFTFASVQKAMRSYGEMLSAVDLEQWLYGYNISNSEKPKKIGLILAGNIPLVGFHDVLCVLATGNHALIKASVQDSRLIKAVLKLLVDIDERFADQFSFVERLEGFDAVIATGSNNSSRYFEYYFSKVPNIIRKNRNSVAVLSGSETEQELFELGNDIFDHFGLGCRNVSKVLFPQNYDIGTFYRAIEPFQPIINHHKYNNNYDYNKSIYLVNSDQHFDNGFLLMRESDALASPLAVLHYSYYDDIASAEQIIDADSENIQCVVSAAQLNIKNQLVAPGASQRPKLWDYADGVDTMLFLTKLSEQG